MAQEKDKIFRPYGEAPKTRGEIDRMGKAALVELAHLLGVGDGADELTITELREGLWIRINSQVPTTNVDNIDPEVLLAAAKKEQEIAEALGPKGPEEWAWLNYLKLLVESTRLYLAFVEEYHSPED